MTEFLNSPALVPSLIGFLAGVLFTGFFSSIKGRLFRSVVQANEKISSEKVASLQAAKSALETEITSLRSSEARFLKHQGELEALAKADQERREEMMKFLEATRTTLQGELKKQETTLIEAIKEAKPVQVVQQVTPTPAQPAPPAQPSKPTESAALQDDRDFVPLQNPADPAPVNPTPVKSAPAESKFEGFAPDPTAAKAESAANALRAALNDTDL